MSAPDFIIKNCPGSSSSSRCPTTWSRLKTSFSDAVRHCDSCNRKVYLCLNERDLKFYSSLKYPIAIDSPELAATLARLEAMPAEPAREPEAELQAQAGAEDAGVAAPVAAHGAATTPSVWRRAATPAGEPAFREEDVEQFDDMPAFMRLLKQSR